MKYNLLLFTILFCAFLPLGAHAAEFVGLVGIPGIEPNGDTDLNAYINALYRLSISIAALLAVIKIVAAGAKYMLSDIITHKEEAKKDIQGALIGLLIVIGAIIILNTINSDLTNLNLTVDPAIIKQGQRIDELIAAQQRSMEERAAALGSQVVTGQCESFWGANGFDMLPGETEEQACERVCESPPSNGGLGGRFIYNYVSSDQCEYVEAVAAKCTANASRTCCEGILNGSWYPGHNQCLTDTNVFSEMPCVGGRGMPTDCTTQIAQCTSAGNRVISQKTGSILCSNDAQSAIGEQNANAEQECVNLGRIYVNNTCQPNTNETPVLPIGN